MRLLGILVGVATPLLIQNNVGRGAGPKKEEDTAAGVSLIKVVV